MKPPTNRKRYLFSFQFIINRSYKIIGTKQNTIADKLKKINQFLQDLSENPNSEIPIIYEEMSEKWLELSEDLEIC